MNVAAATDEGEASEIDLLLAVDFVVEALAVGLRREENVAEKSVFIFDAIAEGGVGPTGFRVVALIFESGAVDVIHFVRRIVEDAIRIAEAFFVVPVGVIESGEAVRPAGASVNIDLRASDESVE